MRNYDVVISAATRLDVLRAALHRYVGRVLGCVSCVCLVNSTCDNRMAINEKLNKRRNLLRWRVSRWRRLQFEIELGRGTDRQRARTAWLLKRIGGAV